MPFKSSQRHFEDILESIRRIEEFVGGMTFPEYELDERTKAAVERKIQIVTEALIRLEMEDAASYPEIDWKGYRAMGNFLRHSYHRVSDEIVWNTVKDDLPILRKTVESALQRLRALANDQEPSGS